MLYLIPTCFILFSCELKPEKKSHTLVHHMVYVIPESGDSSEVQKPLDAADPDSSYIEFVFKPYKLVNIKTVDSSILVDLRYADTSNFLKRNLYDGLRNAYFNCETALMICNAQYFLKRINPAYSLVILDATRPQHIQKLMWDSLKIHRDIKLAYLAPPTETSLHNYGCAVDLTIMDLTTRKLLDMGTEYDFFSGLSQPIYEKLFLKTGDLSKEVLQNRKLLRRVMKRAKFNSINSEWWHFSICTKEEAAARFKLVK